MSTKLPSLTWFQYALGGLFITFFYTISRIICNLFLSSLARIPGPKSAAISNIWYCYHWVHGSYPEDIRQLHLKYGPAVRIAPNEVSFATPQSFNDIYGHATKDHEIFVKSTFYAFPQPEAGIVAERNLEKHREARKLLSHGFSSRALKDQETILHEKVNLLVEQVSRFGDNGLLTLNIKDWYLWLSFDVIGELAFGEAFGALLAAKSHSWIETIHQAAAMVGWFEIGRRLPFMWPVIFFLLPAGMKEKLDVFLKYSRVQVRKRVAAQNSITRTDFFSKLLSSKAKERENEEWLIAQANVLVIAGSDTTATTLTAITYYLCKYPDKQAILQREIRNAFTERNQITGDEVARLPYLNAVIEEALRLFPPTPFGLPRISPGATIDGIWIPKGVVVSTSSWSTTHNDAYFRNAAEFLPERWIAHDDGSKSHRDELNAAKPFSLGSRGCLGINLAYLEMRLTIANLVYAYDWALTDKDFDFIKAAKFEGFWLVPDLKVKFTPAK